MNNVLHNMSNSNPKYKKYILDIDRIEKSINKVNKKEKSVNAAKTNIFNSLNIRKCLEFMEIELTNLLNLHKMNKSMTLIKYLIEDADSYINNSDIVKENKILHSCDLILNEQLHVAYSIKIKNTCMEIREIAEKIAIEGKVSNRNLSGEIDYFNNLIQNKMSLENFEVERLSFLYAYFQDLKIRYERDYSEAIAELEPEPTQIKIKRV